MDAGALDEALDYLSSSSRDTFSFRLNELMSEISNSETMFCSSPLAAQRADRVASLADRIVERSEAERDELTRLLAQTLPYSLCSHQTSADVIHKLLTTAHSLTNATKSFPRKVGRRNLFATSEMAKGIASAVRLHCTDLLIVKWLFKFLNSIVSLVEDDNDDDENTFSFGSVDDSRVYDTEVAQRINTFATDDIAASVGLMLEIFSQREDWICEGAPNFSSFIDTSTQLFFALGTLTCFRGTEEDAVLRGGAFATNKIAEGICGMLNKCTDLETVEACFGFMCNVTDYDGTPEQMTARREIFASEALVDAMVAAGAKNCKTDDAVQWLFRTFTHMTEGLNSTRRCNMFAIPSVVQLVCNVTQYVSSPICVEYLFATVANICVEDSDNDRTVIARRNTFAVPEICHAVCQAAPYAMSSTSVEWLFAAVANICSEFNDEDSVDVMKRRALFANSEIAEAAVVAATYAKTSASVEWLFKGIGYATHCGSRGEFDNLLSRRKPFTTAKMAKTVFKSLKHATTEGAVDGVMMFVGNVANDRDIDVEKGPKLFGGKVARALQRRASRLGIPVPPWVQDLTDIEDRDEGTGSDDEEEETSSSSSSSEGDRDGESENGEAGDAHNSHSVSSGHTEEEDEESGEEQ